MRDRIELLIGLTLVLLDEAREGLSSRQRAQGVVEYMAVVVGVVTAALVILATFTTALSDLGTRVAAAIGSVK
jgi:uncharacterized membrane protein YdfJ with MMPL/SSD domain